ncbi:phage terminase small subunit P27 family [Mycobacterium eburneum]|nr:phage terminase small subunit P27 family [Mycobacterium eburneum]TDH48503.1 phage terminase small subunit P27 family [Mycobacterium eburneum]
MGRRGRQPRPSHLKALEGTWEGRLNRDEAIPEDAAIAPPVKLPADAQAVWDRLAPDLVAKKVLTAWDVDAFAEFCRAVALYNRAAAQAEAEAITIAGSHDGTVMNPAIRVMKLASDMMRATGQRFGLTPGDRAALKVEHGTPAKSGAERLLS